MLVAQAQAQALQQEQQRKGLELKLDTDLARDKQASEDARGWAELQAKYQMDTTMQSMALREEQRMNDMNFGLKQAQAAQAAQPPAQQPGPEGGPFA
jgi:glycine cleavage system regulatory protein